MTALQPTTSKKCRKCGLVKPLDEFRVCSIVADGRSAQCRACLAETDRLRKRGRKPGPATYRDGSLGPEGKVIDDDGRDWAWAYAIYREHPKYPGRFFGTDGSYWYRFCSEFVDEWRQGKPTVCNGKYLVVGFSVNGRIRSFKLHRMILDTFIGPCPEGMEGCHNNDNVRDNRIVNLRWASHGENMADAIRNGRRPRGEHQWSAKLTAAGIRSIRRRVAEGESMSLLAGEYFVHIDTICNAVRRKTWAHVPDEA